jgi:hypothetical protein
MSTTQSPVFRPSVLGAQPNAAHVERRKESRALACRLVFVHSPTETGTGYQRTSLWNISPHGLALFMTHQVDPGTHLRVQFRHLLLGDRVLKVIHCSPSEDGWLVGGELDRPFSGTELRVPVWRPRQRRRDLPVVPDAPFTID